MSAHPQRGHRALALQQKQNDPRVPTQGDMRERVRGAQVGHHFFLLKDVKWQCLGENDTRRSVWMVFRRRTKQTAATVWKSNGNAWGENDMRRSVWMGFRRRTKQTAATVWKSNGNARGRTTRGEVCGWVFAEGQNKQKLQSGTECK